MPAAAIDYSRLLIVSYYGLKEQLLSAYNAFVSIGYTVETYPLFQFSQDAHDRKDNWQDHMCTYIERVRPGVILWWFMNPKFEALSEVIGSCGAGTIQCLFNWDDPFCWDVKELDVANKAKLFDLVFCTCKESVERYVSHGAKHAFFLPPAFDSNIHYPLSAVEEPSQELVQKYTCDVSLCATNLYADSSRYPDQRINRKLLVDKLYAASLSGVFSFKIFGGENLKPEYPASYGGYCPLNENRLAFSLGRIALTTHVTASHHGYLNERFVTIMACGGLMLSDSVSGIEEHATPDRHFILLDHQADPVQQILAILQRPTETLQAIRSEAAKHAYQNWSFSKWVRVIHEKLQRFIGWNAIDWISLYHRDEYQIARLVPLLRRAEHCLSELTSAERLELCRLTSASVVESDDQHIVAQALRLVYIDWHKQGEKALQQMLSHSHNTATDESISVPWFRAPIQSDQFSPTAFKQRYLDRAEIHEAKSLSTLWHYYLQTWKWCCGNKENTRIFTHEKKFTPYDPQPGGALASIAKSNELLPIAIGHDGMSKKQTCWLLSQVLDVHHEPAKKFADFVKLSKGHPNVDFISILVYLFNETN
jgi:spore maturation protein CgeB